METYQIVILGLFFGLVLLEIIYTNFFSKYNQRPKDGVVELFGFFQLNFLVLPLVFGFGYGEGVTGEETNSIDDLLVALGTDTVPHEERSKVA